MQAWGVDGAAEVRRTRIEPHKRAVLGLVRAARGLTRAETWPELEQLGFETITLSRPRRMWDFGTMSNVISADGTFIHGQGVQHREYLADAAFLVALDGPKELLDEVVRAFENPQFLLALGRRDCVPSYPILWGISDDPPAPALEQARAMIESFANQ